jgi:hypothetical protein
LAKKTNAGMNGSDVVIRSRDRQAESCGTGRAAFRNMLIVQDFLLIAFTAMTFA